MEREHKARYSRRNLFVYLRTPSHVLIEHTDPELRPDKLLTSDVVLHKDQFQLLELSYYFFLPLFYID